MFGPQPVAGVLYFYAEDQAVFDRVRAEDADVQFHKGLPDRETFDRMIEEFSGQHFLVILDDLMEEMAHSQLGQDIFTKLSHHR